MCNCHEKTRDKLEQKRAYYLRNRGRILQMSAERYKENPWPGRIKSRQWLKENHERALKTKAKYRAEHKKELAKKQLGRYYANHAEHKSVHAAYRAVNRDKQRAWSKARSAACGEDYARELLAKNTPLSAMDIPQELVEAKMAQIQIRRAVCKMRKDAQQCKT